MSIFNKFADISNCLMDVIFKDLSGLILKVGLFPTQEVLESTAKFLELHMQICMKVIHRGYSTFMKTVEHTLASGKRNFFLSNNSKCDPYMYPFGDKLANNFDHQAWVHNLQIGEEVDAVKFCKNECRAIWSRATVTEIEGYKVYVKFMNDNNKTYQHRGVSMTPFMINKFKTRSLDFEWRENLGKGDFVDIYLGRKGWLYFEIVESHLTENPESGEKIKTISCILADYGDDIYSSDEEKNQFGSL